MDYTEPLIKTKAFHQGAMRRGQNSTQPNRKQQFPTTSLHHKAGTRFVVLFLTGCAAEVRGVHRFFSTRWLCHNIMSFLPGFCSLALLVCDCSNIPMPNNTHLDTLPPAIVVSEITPLSCSRIRYIYCTENVPSHSPRSISTMDLFSPPPATYHLSYVMEFLGSYPGATDWLKILAFGWLLTISRHFIGLLYSNIIGLFCVQASFSEDDYSHRTQPFFILHVAYRSGSFSEWVLAWMAEQPAQGVL